MKVSTALCLLNRALFQVVHGSPHRLLLAPRPLLSRLFLVILNSHDVLMILLGIWDELIAIDFVIEICIFDLELAGLLKLKKPLVLFGIGGVLGPWGSVIRRSSTWRVVPVDWCQFLLQPPDVGFLFGMGPYGARLRVRTSNVVLVPLLLFLHLLFLLWRPLVDALLNGVERKYILERLRKAYTVHFRISF